MRFFYALWIWICLSGIWTSADGRSEQHYEQNKIFISCYHKWASNNMKYFCRDPCGDGDILVQSDQSPRGRFTLKDYGTGAFDVTISDPQESDSGIYWCGVKRFPKDTYERVDLSVPKSKKNANQSSTPQPEATGSQSSTTRSSSLTSEGNTTSSSTTGFEGLAESSRLPYGNAAQSRRLMFAVTPTALTVMVIVSGTVFCTCYIQKRKSHSSNADAESQVTTCTTEAAEGEETQQQIDTLTNATIYSTVNKTNQIPDPPLYSTVSTPAEPRRGKHSVTHADVHIQEKPRTSVLSENTATYDTVRCPETTL